MKRKESNPRVDESVGVCYGRSLQIKTNLLSERFTTLKVFFISDWGDGPVGKALFIQAQGPEFKPQHPQAFYSQNIETMYFEMSFV